MEIENGSILIGVYHWRDPFFTGPWPETEKDHDPVKKCANIDVIKTWDLLENNRYPTFLEMGIQRMVLLSNSGTKRRLKGRLSICNRLFVANASSSGPLKKRFCLRNGWIPCLHVSEHVICQTETVWRTNVVSTRSFSQASKQLVLRSWSCKARRGIHQRWSFWTKVGFIGWILVGCINHV